MRNGERALVSLQCARRKTMALKVNIKTCEKKRKAGGGRGGGSRWPGKCHACCKRFFGELYQQGWRLGIAGSAGVETEHCASGRGTQKGLCIMGWTLWILYLAASLIVGAQDSTEFQRSGEADTHDATNALSASRIRC